MKNKLLRLAELIQEDFPEDLIAAFRSGEKQSLTRRLAITSDAIAFHQNRSEELWLKAGNKRTAEEKRASARAELAAFVFAYLTGDLWDGAECAREAMRALGRQGETDIIKSLSGH